MASDLENKIIQQIEYYFGDINLPKDKFMQGKVKEDDGWISLETLLTFKRLSNLSTDPEVIINAMEKSDSNMVHISDDRKKLRRNPDLAAPEMNEERRKELAARTVYAKGFPKDEQLDDIISFLEPHGPIESCQRRTNLDKATKTQFFKGSCFIIFKDADSAKKFLEAEGIKYKDTELIRKWKNDYLEEKGKQYRENRLKNKKEKAEKSENVAEENKIEFPKGSVLHFTGIKEDQTLTREDIKEQFKEVGDVDTAYIDFKKGDLEGYVRLAEENSAVEFFKKLTDGELKVGEATLKLRVLEGEEEEAFLKRSADSLKERIKNNHGKKGRHGRKRQSNFEGGQRKKRRNH